MNHVSNPIDQGHEVPQNKAPKQARRCPLCLVLGIFVAVLVFFVVNYFSVDSFIIIGSHEVDIEWFANGLRQVAPRAYIHKMHAPSESIKLNGGHESLIRTWNQQFRTRNVIVEKISMDRWMRTPLIAYKPYIEALKGKQLVVVLRGGTCKAYEELLDKQDNETFMEDCRLNPKVMEDPIM